MNGYEVGSYYDVPTVLIGREILLKTGDTLTIDPWWGFKGALPVLTDFHTDEHFVTLGTVGVHAHIDYRFLPPRAFKLFERAFRASDEELWQQVLKLSGGDPQHLMSGIRAVPRRMKCYRHLNALPYETAHWMARLQKKYACAALKKGKCPHRGTPAAAMIPVGGLLVCPAHGLRFDKRGQPVPYLLPEAT